MRNSRSYDITGLELTDDRYTVKQSLIGNRYRALDADGNLVFKGKQKLFKLKEEFPFTDDAGTEVFRVKAGGIIDVAGNYVLSDSQTGEDLVVLDNDVSWLQDTWTIRDAQTEEKLAEINSRGAMATLARGVIGLIPHRYEITDRSGAHVGSIDGQLSVRDTYEVVIDDASTVPKEPIVAAAMVIDAIQDN